MSLARLAVSRHLVPTRYICSGAQLQVCKRVLSTANEENNARRRILDASEKFVSSAGWSEEAMAQGAKEIGLSGASHGQFSRGPVELVEHVAMKCDAALNQAIEERSEELYNLHSWRPRLKLAIALRLELSLPWHEYRAQALGLVVSSSGPNQSYEPAAVSALARTAHELARATLTEEDLHITPGKWRARKIAAAVAYALAEVRALSDNSPNLIDTVNFSNKLVDTLADASDAPAALQDAVSAGAAAAASLGGAALSFLPPKAVGALPHLFDFAANRASSTMSALIASTLDRLLDALPNSPVPQPPKRQPADTPVIVKEEVISSSADQVTPAEAEVVVEIKEEPNRSK